MWEILLVCVNIFHERGKIFCEYMDKLVGIDKFCGYGLILMGMKFWLWRNFVGYVCLIIENIFVAMILDVRIYLLCMDM